MKNETICECGHLKDLHACSGQTIGHEHECNHDAWCEADWCECSTFIPQAKSLRDELVENCEYFDLVHTYYYCAITKLDSGKWSVRDADDNEMVEIHFDTPEAAFAWLKDHLRLNLKKL